MLPAGDADDTDNNDHSRVRRRFALMVCIAACSGQKGCDIAMLAMSKRETMGGIR